MKDTNTSKNFSDAARAVPRLHLYTIGVAPKSSRRGDFSTDVHKAADTIQALAKDEGYADRVNINLEDKALHQRGVFFMKAPEKFAQMVKGIKTVHYVEKPGDKKKKPARKPRRAR